MAKPSQPTKLQTATASMRAVSSPVGCEFACPFCAKTDASLFMGKVNLSAIMGGDDLFDSENVALAALICSKSHVFFVLETDMIAMLTTSVA
jgi:hypothetical protein